MYGKPHFLFISIENSIWKWQTMETLMMMYPKQNKKKKKMRGSHVKCLNWKVYYYCLLSHNFFSISHSTHHRSSSFIVKRAREIVFHCHVPSTQLNATFSLSYEFILVISIHSQFCLLWVFDILPSTFNDDVVNENRLH